MPWKACLAATGFPAVEVQAGHLVAVISGLNTLMVWALECLSQTVPPFTRCFELLPETLPSPRAEAESLPPAIAYTHHFTLGLLVLSLSKYRRALPVSGTKWDSHR